MASQDQLNIETQINAAIQARAALVEANTQKLASQVAVAQELCRALECKELEGYNERIEGTRQGLLQAADATERAGETTRDMGVQMQKSSNLTRPAYPQGDVLALPHFAMLPCHTETPILWYCSLSV